MPRTKEQNQKILDTRKQEIIDCAINFLSCKNYNEFSVDDVARKLKISHGLFYHYFKNKKDLVSKIASYAENILLSSFENALKGLEGEEWVFVFFKHFISVCQNKDLSLLIRLIINVAKNNQINEKHRHNIDNLEKFYKTNIMKSIKLLSVEGKLLHSIEVTLRIISLIINGIVLLAAEGKMGESPLKAKHLINTIIKQAS